jgi:hypothetical protein
LTGDRNGYIMLYVETARAGLHLADTLQASGVNIMVNYNSNPEVNDWNEDGRKDLITGEESYVAPNTGNIRVYLNSGTNANPVFTTYTCISAGGSQIYTFRATTRIVDLDNDSKKDLLIGQGDGLVFFYRNVGTNAAPVFNAAYDTLKQTNGIPIDAYVGSRIYFVDWRGDGDKDLLISGFDGYVELYENSTIVGVEEGVNQSLIRDLSVCPNVVRTGAKFVFAVTKTCAVKAAVYSADGRIVERIAEGARTPGVYEFHWDTSDIPAGVYWLRVNAQSESQAARVVVVK